jgi:hypothetical protein
MNRLLISLALAAVAQLPFGATLSSTEVAGPGAVMAQDNDDRPRPRQAGRDDDDDDDDDDRPRPRQSDDDDDDDDDRPRPRQSDDDDDDDDDRPRPRQSNDDDDDDDRPRPRQTNDDDDDDDRPRPRQTNDDDDDDDRPRPRQSNDDDDDDSRPRAPVANDPSPQTQARPAAQQPAPRRDPPPEPLAEQAAGELVALDLSDEDLAVLLAQGFAVIEQVTLVDIGVTSFRLRIPSGVDLASARGTVQALPSGQDADFNHFYRSEQDVLAASAPETSQLPRPCDGMHCPALEQINWPGGQSEGAVCTIDTVSIGIVDTGLNAEHETFADADIDLVRISDEELQPSRAVHGTAVAALLVGSPSSRSPGLLPDVTLHAVDVFHRDGGDERSDVFSLIRGLDHLGETGVRVINLSLAGPPNAVLEEAVRRLVEEKGIVVVAAAGNNGPRAEPAYPAAYPGVIAVTAVDYRNTIYRRAGQGDHIDIAAPGVEVWTAASISGARSKTGTSFAAPFVTAAAALLLDREPMLTPADVVARLTQDAADLGDTGFDPVYGHGLLTVQLDCAA